MQAVREERAAVLLPPPRPRREEGGGQSAARLGSWFVARADAQGGRVQTLLEERAGRLLPPPLMRSIASGEHEVHWPRAAVELARSWRHASTVAARGFTYAQRLRRTTSSNWAHFFTYAQRLLVPTVKTKFR